MSFLEPMAFRYALFMIGYGLPKHNGRLVLSRRRRRARPGRVTTLNEFTIAFFIPNVTFWKSLIKCVKGKLKYYLCQD
jgi:hypothetical protein